MSKCSTQVLQIVLTLPQDKSLLGFWRILDQHWGVYDGEATPRDGADGAPDDESSDDESDPEGPPAPLLAIENGEVETEAPVESIVEGDSQRPVVASPAMLEGTPDDPIDEPMEEPEPDPVEAAPSAAIAAPSPVESFVKETQPQDRKAELLAKLEQLKTGVPKLEGGVIVA